MEEKPNYYAIIPANVRYDNELTANSKLLYGEITSLCNNEGICWAGNEYFAKLYNVSKETISRWVSQLNKKKYINVKMFYKKDSKEIDKRIITINQLIPIDENVNTYPQNNQGGIDKNIKENNTSINNNICSSLAEDFNKLWKIYPRKDGKNQAFNHYKAWINGKSYAGKIEKLTNPEMWYAIRIYQCNIKKNKTEKQYIKMGSTFFNEAIYEYASYYRENPEGWEKKIKEILESE